MRSTNNYVFVSIEAEYKEKITSESGSLTLDLMSFDRVIVDKKDDSVVYNNLEHKKVCARVVAIPEKLTSDILSFQKYPGLPQPNRYVSHDMIQLHGVQLLQYDCSLWEPEYYRYCDIEQQVQVNDLVYYHFLSIEEENRVKVAGEKVYKIPYNNILCVVRDGQIIATSGHVLVEAIYPDNAVDIGNNVKGFISKSGIVTQIGVNYTMQEGIVKHVCLPFKGDEICFAEGDHIVFKRFGDWIVNVEGKDYFIIKYNDIEAIIETE